FCGALVTARCAYIAAADGFLCLMACSAARASRVTSMEAPQPKPFAPDAGAPEAVDPPFAPLPDFLPAAAGEAFLSSLLPAGAVAVDFPPISKVCVTAGEAANSNREQTSQ